MKVPKKELRSSQFSTLRRIPPLDYGRWPLGQRGMLSLNSQLLITPSRIVPGSRLLGEPSAMGRTC